MTAKSLLPLYADRPDRQGRDRLEILTALLGAPSVDPVFRADVIRIPRDHPVFRWNCVVQDCERVRSGGTSLCSAHGEQWAQARAAGGGLAAFLEEAVPLEASEWLEETACRLCPERPAAHTRLHLCARHQQRWHRHRAAQPGGADVEAWVAGEESFRGFGECRVTVCPNLAASAIGLCCTHATRYEQDGRAGGAEASKYGARDHEQHGTPVPVHYFDEMAFRRWCASARPVLWAGQVNLRGLRPLLRAEIQWCLFACTQRSRPGRWDLTWLQRLVNLCRDRDLNSLVDLDLKDFPRFCGGIAKVMLHQLRLVYFTRPAAGTRVSWRPTTSGCASRTAPATST